MPLLYNFYSKFNRLHTFDPVFSLNWFCSVLFSCFVLFHSHTVVCDVIIKLKIVLNSELELYSLQTLFCEG